MNPKKYSWIDLWDAIKSSLLSSHTHKNIKVPSTPHTVPQLSCKPELFASPPFELELEDFYWLCKGFSFEASPI